MTVRVSQGYPQGVRLCWFPGTFGFDNVDQLHTISYDGTTHVADATYGYDTAGRRTSASGTLVRPLLDNVLAGANYDAGNHLTAAGANNITYDGNGNLTSAAGPMTNTLTWNARNQLTGTANGSTFAYDALGRLVSRTAGGTTTTYLYDGLNQTMANGNALLRGLGLDELQAEVTSGGAVSYLTDALGSPVMLADAGQSVTTAYSYGAYGAIASTGAGGPATTDTPFKYTGADVNQTDQLVYLRNRFYSPQVLRFVGEDPIGLNGGINAYAYVGGNPLSYGDPTGLSPWGGLGGDISWQEAFGLSATQSVAESSPLSGIPLPNASISATIPTPFKIGSIPTILSFRMKQTSSGGSCTIGWGPGVGASLSTRYSDNVLNQSAGDPSGWGITAAYSLPFISNVFGTSGTYTYYADGASTMSGGPATVGGSISGSVTVGYTVKW